MRSANRISCQMVTILPFKVQTWTLLSSKHFTTAYRAGSIATAAKVREVRVPAPAEDGRVALAHLRERGLQLVLGVADVRAPASQFDLGLADKQAGKGEGHADVDLLGRVNSDYLRVECHGHF